jgi:hypothetical protein
VSDVRHYLSRAGKDVFDDYKERAKNRMKSKASISHDEAIVRRLRQNPDFAVEYLKAALEDEDEPRVLLKLLAMRLQGMVEALKTQEQDRAINELKFAGTTLAAGRSTVPTITNVIFTPGTVPATL